MFGCIYSFSNQIHPYMLFIILFKLNFSFETETEPETSSHNKLERSNVSFVSRTAVEINQILQNVDVCLH